MHKAPAGVMWNVVGDGPIGVALAEALGNRVGGPYGPGHSKTVMRTSRAVIVVVTDGHQATQLARLAHSGQMIVDLTTQSVSSALGAAGAARTRGAVYVGGGLVGGVDAVRAKAATLLLGPRPTAIRASQELSTLGRVEAFDRLDQAVAAKLLHNWCLLAWSWTLVGALREAVALGIPEEFIRTLEHGTAGRSPTSTSVTRDWRGPASSSYVSRLARKDVDAISDTFPGLTDGAIGLGSRLRAAFDELPDSPFTTGILRSFGLTQ